MTRKTHTILIIDDDVDQLQILSAALERDYEVLTATDGLDGYGMACARAPLRGHPRCHDAARRRLDGPAKAPANPATKDTRIVIATALDGETVAEEAANLNVSLVLRKPIDLKQLKDAIGRLDASRSV